MPSANQLIVLTRDLAEAPPEFQLFPCATVQARDGPFLMDEAAMAAMISAFREARNDMVIDYEHQTLTDGEAYAPCSPRV
jgi:phage I-like protein